VACRESKPGCEIRYHSQYASSRIPSLKSRLLCAPCNRRARRISTRKTILILNGYLLSRSLILSASHLVERCSCMHYCVDLFGFVPFPCPLRSSHLLFGISIQAHLFDAPFIVLITVLGAWGEPCTSLALNCYFQTSPQPVIKMRGFASGWGRFRFRCCRLLPGCHLKGRLRDSIEGTSVFKCEPSRQHREHRHKLSSANSWHLRVRGNDTTRSKSIRDPHLLPVDEEDHRPRGSSEASRQARYSRAPPPMFRNDSEQCHYSAAPMFTPRYHPGCPAGAQQTPCCSPSSSMHSVFSAFPTSPSLLPTTSRRLFLR
jgi:hypothetical protein